LVVFFLLFTPDHSHLNKSTCAAMASVIAQEPARGKLCRPSSQQPARTSHNLSDYYLNLLPADIPHLSVTVDQSTSSSPFPSPGSPFLPPPRLSAHEFAAKPVEQIMRAIETKRKSHEQANGSAQTRDGEATPTIHLPGPTSPPATPTPLSFQTLDTPPPTVNIPDLPPTQSDKLSQRESLTSSRPAPPSPAISRRTSAAHSSYARSRPQSRVTSLSYPPPAAEGLSSGDVSVEGSSLTIVPSKLRSLLVKVRDFAYPASDDRHLGKGPDVPRPNRPRYRGSTYSSASSACEDDDAVDEEDQQPTTWTEFRLNTLSQHIWGEPRASQAGPSRTDFGRNFEPASPSEELSEPEYGDEDEDSQGGDDEPLVPGKYRALYAFEPEGTAEMALEEEQIVHVIGRGGGVGWAIVEKEGGGHALVPESYLELLQADE
jgi:hypothetical protein